VVAGLVKRAAREAVAAAAFGTRLWPVVGDGRAVVLRYHRVGGSAAAPVPLSVTPREFEAQLRFLRSRCRVVSAREIAETVAKRRPLPPRAVAITFDDGYEDNFSVAFPLLARYGLHATFFVTAGWIGTERLLWWDKVHEFVRQAAAAGYPPMDYEELPEPVAAALARAEVRTPAGVERLESELVAALRSLDLPPEELDDLAEQVAAALGAGEARVDGDRAMSWDQVRRLREGGMEIGSHTMSHPELATTPAERAYEELEQSKKTIERELGEPIELLAYPAGDYNQDVVDLVLEAGYEAAFTTAAGPVCEGDDPFTLRRIGVWRGGYRGVFSRFSPCVFGLQIRRLARRAGT